MTCLSCQRTERQEWFAKNRLNQQAGYTAVTALALLQTWWGAVLMRMVPGKSCTVFRRGNPEVTWSPTPVSQVHGCVCDRLWQHRELLKPPAIFWPPAWQGKQELDRECHSWRIHMGNWETAYLSSSDRCSRCHFSQCRRHLKVDFRAKIVMSSSSSSCDQARNAPVFHWHRKGLIWDAQKSVA